MAKNKVLYFLFGHTTRDLNMIVCLHFRIYRKCITVGSIWFNIICVVIVPSFVKNTYLYFVFSNYSNINLVINIFIY